MSKPAIAPAPQSSHDIEQPHGIEQEVQRCLTANPELKVSSLVVRRIDQGICLQGVAESQDDARCLCSLAKTVTGVERVLDRLLIAPSYTAPPKG